MYVTGRGERGVSGCGRRCRVSGRCLVRQRPALHTGPSEPVSLSHQSHLCRTASPLLVCHNTMKSRSRVHLQEERGGGGGEGRGGKGRGGGALILLATSLLHTTKSCVYCAITYFSVKLSQLHLLYELVICCCRWSLGQAQQPGKTRAQPAALTHCKPVQPIGENRRSQRAPDQPHT